MRHTAFAVVGGLLSVALVYCLGAFIGWDWNPGHWGFDARTLIGVFAVVALLCGCAGGAGIAEAFE